MRSMDDDDAISIAELASLVSRLQRKLNQLRCEAGAVDDQLSVINVQLATYEPTYQAAAELLSKLRLAHRDRAIDSE